MTKYNDLKDMIRNLRTTFDESSVDTINSNKDIADSDKDLKVLFLLLDAFSNTLGDIDLDVHDENLTVDNISTQMFLLGKYEAYNDVIRHLTIVLEGNGLLDG